eukprot:1222055-Rhodomonas_salina.1
MQPDASRRQLQHSSSRQAQSRERTFSRVSSTLCCPALSFLMLALNSRNWSGSSTRFTCKVHTHTNQDARSSAPVQRLASNTHTLTSQIKSRAHERAAAAAAIAAAPIAIAIAAAATAIAANATATAAATPRAP